MGFLHWHASKMVSDATTQRALALDLSLRVTTPAPSSWFRTHWYNGCLVWGVQLIKQQCTLDICPLIYGQAHFDYTPALSPNVIVAALFGILLLLQIGLAIKWKTWGFLGGMFGGIVLEIMGYIGRVMMSSNPFAKNPFLMCVYFSPLSHRCSNPLQLPHLRDHRPSLPERLNLHVSRPHGRGLWRKSLQVQATNLHHDVRFLRPALSCAPSRWWRPGLDSDNPRPAKYGHQHHDRRPRLPSRIPLALHYPLL